MMSSALQNSCYAMQRVLTLCFIPKSIIHGPAHESIFVGWSLGCLAGTKSAGLIQTYAQGVRALSLLDDRTSKPRACLKAVALETARFPEDLCQRTLGWYGCVPACAFLELFEAASRFRLLLPQWHFVCPDDLYTSSDLNASSVDEINKRRALYTITADVYVMPDTTHSTLGIDHARDIAVRMRA